ncbi:hypothetical protein Taro_020868 [Colocasia esculenta]|uniref:Uncharacterized protein n=1 Tax=Colocasia esculenta TaxID=4460 RepID=A0A843V9T4_COLES|nr:hypothetical protein [Colocasia esculenta]
MEQRLANSWRMTVNEKKFIEDVVLSNLRVDGRLPFDYRSLNIDLGRHVQNLFRAFLFHGLLKDGQSEVQLGHTRVMSYVTSQLVQPYRDRPNEGTLSIFTEFSPMADPYFEAGRPGELAIELGRIIDRGLRESRAVDMESLCIVAGRFVWAVRIDVHILDNGGNLIDAANIAALAALLTFRRPECSIGGDGQEVITYPPECLMQVVDPTYHEEAVMGGRITLIVNSSGDVCAVQKAGGEGVMPSVIMQCLRIASTKAAELTSAIEKTVDAYNEGRIVRQIKRHITSSAVEVNIPQINIKKNDVEGLSYHSEGLKNKPDKSYSSEGYAIGVGTTSSPPRVSRIVLHGEKAAKTNVRLKVNDNSAAVVRVIIWEVGMIGIRFACRHTPEMAGWRRVV